MSAGDLLIQLRAADSEALTEWEQEFIEGIDTWLHTPPPVHHEDCSCEACSNWRYGLTPEQREKAVEILADLPDRRLALQVLRLPGLLPSDRAFAQAMLFKAERTARQRSRLRRILAARTPIKPGVCRMTD